MIDRTRLEALIKRTFLDYQQTSAFLEHPLVLNRAEGLFYWDIEGKRYFDAIGGIFVAVLGHRHPRVVDKLASFLGPPDVARFRFKTKIVEFRKAAEPDSITVRVIDR